MTTATVEEKVVHASESTHWYTRDGKPQYQVTGANGNLRDATLRDARKLDLVPGVSTILKCASAPGLERWKINQVLLAAMTLPKDPFETTDSFMARVLTDSQEQAKKAAERGTRIHAAVQGHFQREMPSQEYFPHCMGVDKALREHFGVQEWIAEKSFAHPSLPYGGKIDLHCNGERRIVLDFKTKEFDEVPTKANKLKLHWDEHLLQLVAYGQGTFIDTAPFECVSVFISVTVPGLVHVHLWDSADHERAWSMFQALLVYYCHKNRFNC